MQLEKENKIMLCRIGAAGAMLIAGELLKNQEGTAAVVSTVLLWIAYAVAGYDVLWRAVRNIARGRVFDENFLMAVATVGAFGTGDYAEGASVMVFYQLGELFSDLAVDRSRRSIAELMDICPETANVERDGVVSEVDPDDVAVGEIIVIKPGERIPIDGEVNEGTSTLNTSAITGESVERSVNCGDTVISGCINGAGLLRVKTTKEFSDSTVSKILDLVENASSRKAHSENFITKFAQVYTPTVVISAVLLATIPPLFFSQAWSVWVHRALIFLVISCPCALVISIPLTFFCGMGGASKRGILVKGSNYLEALSKIDTVVFDKTGTLTQGVFEVSCVHAHDISEEKLLEIAAGAEMYSNHPIGASIRAAYGKEIGADRVSDVREIAGRGVAAVIDGEEVLAGSKKLLSENGISFETDCGCVGTIVYIAANGRYVGHILISDKVKPTSADAIKRLKREGIAKTVMLTGDAQQIAEHISSQLGIDEYHAELLPNDKVSCIEKLIETANGGVAFVGDGVNDAPVIARADVGIAMGALGSDAAIEAADVVLMDDDPDKLADAIEISRKTHRIVNANIVFALGVKLAVLVLGAFGKANMWEAVFADVGVSVLAILNAMRATRFKTEK